MRAVALTLTVLLAGCGQKANEQEAKEVSAPAAQNISVENTAAEPLTPSAGPSSQNASATENELGSLPPADAELRFVGLWATSEANCAAKGWRFTAHTLAAADGPNCSIYKVTKAPGGYDLAARCPAKKPNELDLIKLRFAESARAMLVESNAIKPMGLIYCGK